MRISFAPERSRSNLLFETEQAFRERPASTPDAIVQALFFAKLQEQFVFGIVDRRIHGRFVVAGNDPVPARPDELHLRKIHVFAVLMAAGVPRQFHFNASGFRILTEMFLDLSYLVVYIV